MKLFESKIINRIALGKLIGFIYGLGAFFIMPIFFPEANIILSWAIFFWYISLGAMIGLSGIITKYPIFKMKIPAWIRGIYIGAWMNFILALFMYDNLTILMVNTAFDGWSPFRIVVEGALFGLIVDFITTKYIGEGNDLLK